jgi:hypothetical protein
MRTTLTLDDDTAAMVEQIRHDEGKTLKQIVNELLRLGIVAKKSAVQRQPQYDTPELDAGPCRYSDLDNIGEILAVAEREDYS